LTLELFPQPFSICKITSYIPLPDGICFFAHTDKEYSLVCETDHLPPATVECENDWRMFRIAGTLDFSLIGILSRITAILAEAQIGVFCISTYDTDYILIKSHNLVPAISALAADGYTFINI